MKKLSLSLALALSFALAQAQSSVTIYGILDVGYIGTSYTGTGTSATTKQVNNTFGQSAQQTSRLGFKGTEDLGNGTSAFFTIETGLNPDNSTVSTFNNRQSFVGIKQNGLGSVAIGTQYTAIYKAVMQTDAAQYTNLVGDVITPSSPQAVGNSGTGPYASASSSSGSTDAYTVRTANTISATTETVNGLTGTAFYTANNQNSTQTSATAGGQNNSNGWGLGINYEWQKLFVTANYQALKNNTTGTLTSPTPALWTTASGGVNTQDNQTYVAGTYDFGILKTYAQWINRKATDTINTGYYANRTAQQLGVRGFFTPVIESWASAGNGRVTAFGSGQPTANFIGYQLGSNYWLSKRTNLYAIYGHSQTSSVTQIPAVASSNYALGVRHTF